MSIHLAKGLQLALALLGPVVTTTVFNWRALVTARNNAIINACTATRRPDATE